MNLPVELEESLVAKLRSAIDALDRGNDKIAGNKLGAFINHVEAQRGKKFSEEDADGLIEKANRIIEAIAVF